MVIAIDFDGTCVKHDYPRVGVDVGAVPVLKKLIEDGHQLLLNSMRSYHPVVYAEPERGVYRDIDTLTEAVEWFKQNGIPLYGINKNPKQDKWTESPKVYAHLYIDDAALGCPVKNDGDGTGRYVDWRAVAEEFGYDYDELCSRFV